MNGSIPPRRAVIYGLAVVLSLYVLGRIASQEIERFVEGQNDFMALYAGARLVTEGDLYNYQQLQQTELSTTGYVSEAHGYIRPAFVAGAMWPLGQLPYRTALRVWQAASLAALVGFVWFWDPDRRLITALAVIVSLPVLLVLLKGQDTLFLLAAGAASLRLRMAKRPVAAGVVFSLCAAKVHLFLMTPLWLVAQKEWGVLKGLLCGGAALYAFSTAVAGWSWPAEMWREAMNPAFTPSPEGMINLHGAIIGLPLAGLWELLLAGGAAWAVWRLSNGGTFEVGLAVSLLAGLLASGSGTPRTVWQRRGTRRPPPPSGACGFRS